jgi:hypothetical protein
MKDALDGYLKAIGIDKKVHEMKVLERWGEVMGEAVEKRTENIYIKNRVLHVELNSSVMRNELMQQRSIIITKINTISGIPLIDEIFFK